MKKTLIKKIYGFLVLGLLSIPSTTLMAVSNPTLTPNQTAAVMGIITNFILDDNNNELSNVAVLAIEKIKSYATSNGTSVSPTIQDYIDAGIIGINNSNVSDMNELVENLSPNEVASKEKLQVLVNTLVSHTDTSAFKIKIDTNNIPNHSNPPSNTEFTIPISGGSHNVDCDDDGVNEAININGAYTCQYATPGIYTVSVTGSVSRIVFWRTPAAQKLISIEQWGTPKWITMHIAFSGCYNMTYNATDKPDLTLVTDISAMFLGADKFNGDIGDWDVSNVRNMEMMFAGTKNFNQDIGNWNTSKVTNMKDMFESALAFNQDIGQWDTSKVTTMYRMFQDASSFNQNINSWDVSNVTSMPFMFKRLYKPMSFNQSLSTWDVSRVTDMWGMFEGNRAFNENISDWNVSAVTNMADMFHLAVVFNQDISNWDVGKVTNMSKMFRNASSFNKDISNWNVEEVTNMKSMFLAAENFNQNLENWDVSLVTDMTFMFASASSFSDNNLSQWDVNSVTSHDRFMEGAGSGNIEPSWQP